MKNLSSNPAVASGTIAATSKIVPAGSLEDGDGGGEGKGGGGGDGDGEESIQPDMTIFNFVG